VLDGHRVRGRIEVDVCVGPGAGVEMLRFHCVATDVARESREGFVQCICCIGVPFFFILFLILDLKSDTACVMSLLTDNRPDSLGVGDLNRLLLVGRVTLPRVG
jgi:hypothetical protein